MWINREAESWTPLAPWLVLSKCLQTEGEKNGLTTSEGLWLSYKWCTCRGEIRRIRPPNLCRTRLFLYPDWIDRDGKGRRSLLTATELEHEPHLNSCLGKGHSLLSCLVLPLWCSKQCKAFITFLFPSWSIFSLFQPSSPVLRIKPRTSFVLGTHSTTKPFIRIDVYRLTRCDTQAVILSPPKVKLHTCSWKAEL